MKFELWTGENSYKIIHIGGEVKPDTLINLQHKETFELDSLYELKEWHDNYEKTRNPSLFERGDFTLHAGGKSDFKIECDALTEAEIESLAYLISKKKKFSKVFGIPRGGLRLEHALRKYQDHEEQTILIVDDVYSTGKSFIDFRKELVEQYNYSEPDIKGVCIFSRGRLIWNWVTPMFQMWQ